MSLSLLMAFCLGCAAPRTVPFTTLVQGPHYLRDTTPENVVIRSAEEQQDFVDRHAFAGKPSFPPVDYRKQMVLGVILGPQSTGAIRVQITRIEDRGRTLLVHSVRWLPPPNAFVTEEIGYPVHLVSIERTGKSIAFAPTVDQVRK